MNILKGKIKKNDIFFDNSVYTIFIILVQSLTIFHFGGWEEFVNYFPFNGDNRAYLFIVFKIEYLIKGQDYNMFHSIAIPGLGFLIFLFKKVFFNLPAVFAFYITMLIFYYLTLNSIRTLFSSYISYIFLIIGWEFSMTSTLGGTEPVICFLVILSLSCYLKNDNKLSLFLIVLASVI